MPVLFVRHAQALARSEWHGEDRGRELSDRGRRQARKLVPVLKEFKPVLILSSPYLRCVDTVAPLADALGLKVEETEALAEGAGREALDLARSVAKQSVVLCSHGDVIPEVLHALVAEDRIDLGRNPHYAKASVWVLEVRKSKFTKGQYLRPPG